MGEQNPKDRNKVYRLSLIEDSTHKRIRSVKFTRLSFIYLSVSAFVVLVLLIYCSIAFTPLRSAIPGYPDAHSKKVALENAIKIDSLESAITRWTLYSTNLSRVLSGESTINFDSLMAEGGGVRYLSEKNEAELARQDSLLRQSVAKSEQFGVGSEGTRKLPIEGMHFFSPLKGVISEPFDAVLHPAIDIKTNEGEMVRAILDGTVIRTAWEDSEGYVIVLQHRDNVISIYSNNQRSLVSTGDVINAGTPVAIDRTHLHLELWQDGTALDPTKYITF